MLAICCLAIDAYDGEVHPTGIEWARQTIAANRNTKHHGDCTQVAVTCIRCAIDTASKSADAILAALDAAGSAVVPVEPTEEMLDAADDAFWTAVTDAKGRSTRLYGKPGIASSEATKPVYAAMLAAAPKP